MRWEWFVVLAVLAIGTWIAIEVTRSKAATKAPPRRRFDPSAPSDVLIGEPMPTPGWRGFHLAVAGESHDNADGSSRQEILAAAVIGEAVSLVPEPENPYDHLAARVILTGSSRQIGYLPRHHGLTTRIKSGNVRARLAKVRGGTYDKPTRGAVLWIEVPETEAKVNKTT